MKNSNYDLVAALHNKLEAVSIYDQYIRDCSGETECSSVWQQLKRDDERHVTLLREEIARHAKENQFD